MATVYWRREGCHLWSVRSCLQAGPGWGGWEHHDDRRETGAGPTQCAGVGYPVRHRALAGGGAPAGALDGEKDMRFNPFQGICPSAARMFPRGKEVS